ncbi:MAG: flagellar export protein FliJ [Planctomycetales bacterium]|nr:flagellar export protein FliJ [Planctomycetales bacterium]
MSNYQFRFQSVEMVRRRSRDQAAKAFEQADLARRMLAAQVEDLLAEHRQQHAVQNSALQGHVDAQRLLESQRYQLHLMQQVAGLKSQIQMVEAEVERRRKTLVSKEQEVQTLERLKARELEAWNHTQLRREQEALDAWAGFQHWLRVSQSHLDDYSHP